MSMMTARSEQVVDVCVIGAGLSGLVCTRALVDSGARVVLVEARDRVGGRLLSDRSATGARVDVGGAYVGPTQDHVLELAAEFGVDTYPVYTEGKAVTLVPGLRAEHEDTIPPLGIVSLLDMNAALNRMDSEAEQVPGDAPWDAPGAKAMDQRTVAEWLQTNTTTSSAHSLLTTLMRTLLCAEPAEVSLLAWLSSIATAPGGAQRIIGVADGAQERKFVQGAQALCEAVAGVLPPGVLRLCSPVQHIEWQRSDGRVRVQLQGGDFLLSQRVVLALAPSLYARLSYTPPLPLPRVALADRMPMGCIIKTVTFYERAWWRDLGFSGSLTDPDGPVIYSMDDTQPDGSHPAIVGFVVADAAREWAVWSPQQRQQAICSQYSRVWRAEAALRPCAYVERAWNEEEYSGGCYGPVTPPNVLSQLGHLLREPMGRVHFAGTEAAGLWNGYMDGAVSRGKECAVEVVAALQQDYAEGNAVLCPPRLSLPAYATAAPRVCLPHTTVRAPLLLRMLPGPRAFLSACAGLLTTLTAYTTFRAGQARWVWATTLTTPLLGFGSLYLNSSERPLTAAVLLGGAASVLAAALLSR